MKLIQRSVQQMHRAVILGVINKSYATQKLTIKQGVPLNVWSDRRDDVVREPQTLAFSAYFAFIMMITICLPHR
jgi:hypothetical protein